MVNYPESLDTDVEIPRVDDNITEIGGEVINALREAVFAIETTLGEDPHGSATDLVTRLAVALDDNGNLKASALAVAGILTSPIVNADISSSAGIEESKLDLDYGTVQLKTWIDALNVLVAALQVSVAQDIANLTSHIAHPGVYGRHRLSDIDGFGGTFDGYTAKTALEDVDSRMTAHLADATDAHDASAISTDNSRFGTITADNAQTAMEQLEDLQLSEVVKHRDNQHGNGILETQDAFLDGYQHSVAIIEDASSAASSTGDTYIRFQSTPSASIFNSVSRNDVVELTVSGTTYKFVIESTSSPITLNIYGIVPVSGSGTMSVYRTPEETDRPSVLAVAIRNDDITWRPSTIQLVHPRAAFILSSGFNGTLLASGSIENVRFKYYGGVSGDTGDLDLYTAMNAFSSVPSTWTAGNVAKVLNTDLLNPQGSSATHHPLVAFPYNGELGIAIDVPGSDGYVEIGTPSSNSASTSLGFTEGDISYGLSPRSCYVDGYNMSDVRKFIETSGTISSSSVITVSGIDLKAEGLQAGALVRISDSDDGTYVATAIGNTTLTFDTSFEHDFTSNVGSSVQLVSYADHFSLISSPADATLYEVFVDRMDGYDQMRLFASARLTYSGLGSFSSTFIDVIAVSRNFSTASRRVFWDQSARTLEFGEQATVSGSPSIDSPGTEVDVPSSNEEGFRAKLYDGDGSDYIEVELALTMPVVDGYMDVEISPRISEERFIQVATILHDKTDFKQIDDTRLFGTVGRQDVRDDFTRDFVSYPRSILRGPGVIRGMASSGVSSTSLTVEGGEVLVDGKIKSLRKQSIAIPADAGSGTETYNLYVDSDGVLRLHQDDLFSAGVIATPAIAELLTSTNKTLLAQIVVSFPGKTISSISDMRRFVNDIDSKVELLIEENDITASRFASLDAAFNYANAVQTASGVVPRIAKIRGEVFLTSSVSVPDHMTIEGDGYGPASSGAKLTFLSTTATLSVGTGTVIRDLTFYRSGTLSVGFISGTTIDRLFVEGCGFEFASQTLLNNAIVCDRLVESNISRNKFKNVGRGISISGHLLRSSIDHNVFGGVHQNAIYVDNPGSFGAMDSTISENVISTATLDNGSDTALIRLTSPQRTIVRGNSMICDGTPGANGSMLWFEDTSSYCHVAENTFINSGSSVGFEIAILFDGGGASTGSDHFFDVIRDNVITGFNGGSAQAISLKDCDNTLINGNYVFACRKPLDAEDCKWLTINANVLNSSEDAIVVYIHSSATEHIMLTNNDIANSTWPALTSRVAHIDGNTAVGGTIRGNIILYSGIVAGSTTAAALYVNGPEWNISDNEIGVANAGTSFVTEAPVTLGALADFSTIAYNNLYHALLSTAPTRLSISSSALGVANLLNRGASYIINRRGIEAIIEIHPLGTGQSWSYSSGTQDIFSTNTFYTGTHPNASFSFNEDLVPHGAIVDKIEVDYDLSPGTTADLTILWEKYDSSSFAIAAATIRAATVVSSTGFSQTEVITPTTPPIYMDRGDTHTLTFTLTNSSGSYSITIYSIRIYYTY
jgi:hypothetical protein